MVIIMLGARSRLRPLPLSLVGWCASCNNNDDDNNDDDDNNNNNNDDNNNNDNNNNDNDNNINNSNISTIEYDKHHKHKDLEIENTKM